MTSNDQFLHAIPGPSAYGSPAYMDQLAAVLNTVNQETQAQRNVAFFWDDGPGTFTPPGHWISISEDLIKQYRPSNEQAVRILALLSAAQADSGVEAWYVKYTWWSVRPISAIWRLCDGGGKLCTESEVRADPSRATYRGKWYSPITTPSFPSYPSAHATFSGAASTVLSSFFPAAAAKVKAMADEAAQSRVLGGIHYPEDSRDGLVLGRIIGNLALDRARTDGGQ
jgi:membrane-associated phospholipid phosphatase